MRLSTDSEVIEEEAVHWVVKRDSGKWTEANQAQLDAWLGEHVAHRIAFLRLEAAWVKCDRLRVLGAGVEPGVVPPRGSWGSHFFSGFLPETRPPPSNEPVVSAS